MMTASNANALIHSDLKDLAAATKKLANHAIHLGQLRLWHLFPQMGWFFCYNVCPSPYY
ncbi:unnamed protein product [Prunus armeniaca]|uniref:Uncharacterized protein n=1 Tax=Prunus armeniaca TaxID=36596 RepID=A0A6J5VJU3_PRUAR|nr:unnamed protein product [Prunus armeniaca]CAB4319755.1 unnamed protein product [Prunus armeniaca]